MNTYLLNSQANSTTKGNASVLACTLGCFFVSCTYLCDFQLGELVAQHNGLGWCLSTVAEPMGRLERLMPHHVHVALIEKMAMHDEVLVRTLVTVGSRQDWSRDLPLCVWAAWLSLDMLTLLVLFALISNRRSSSRKDLFWLQRVQSMVS